MNHAKLALLVALTGLVAACGGSGDSTPIAGPSPTPTPSPTPPPPTANATGKLLDSAVGGIAYNCGGVTGTTDNLGQFDYVSGQSCTFSIGGVTLGTAVGAALLTPASLVSGATPGVPNAAVTDIARLLQSLDSDGDPNNGILIADSVRTALAGASLPAFGSAGFAAAAATLVNQAIPGRALVDATTAAAHLDLSLLGLYSGGYNCTYSGIVNGVNTVLGGVAITIDSGVVTGAGTPQGSSNTFTVGGTVTSTGAANLTGGTTSTGATFEGSFTSDGTVAGTQGSGTWNDPSLGSGTWDCQHL